MLSLNSVIQWKTGDKLVPMYFKGIVQSGDPQTDDDRKEGPVGAIMACPVHLGEDHVYTGVFMAYDFVDLDGEPINFEG